MSSTDAPEVPAAVEDERSRWFVPALVVGWAIIAVGIVGMFGDSDRTKPFELVRFVIGFLLVHDLVVVPIVIAVAWVVTRIVPVVAQGPVRGALALSAVVVVFAWPLLQRYGERPTNSSALPLDYARTVPVVLGAIWLAAMVVVATRVVIARRRSAR